MTPNQPFLASQRDVLLLARILLVILFVMFGWKKIVDFPGTIAFMGSEGAPAPIISAAISVVMELFVGIAIRSVSRRGRSHCCWHSIRSAPASSATTTGR